MTKNKWLIVGFVALFIIAVLVWRNRKSIKSTAESIIDKTVDAVSNKNNQSVINSLHPLARKNFSDFINEIEERTGYNVIITSGYRPSKKQASLDAANSSNADAGFSEHEFGFAIDLNLQKGVTMIRKKSPKADWIKTGIVDIAKKYNLRWGGNFKKYYDPVHFDMELFTITQLRAAAIKQFGSNPNNWKGNEVVLA